jgi:hypothetical protein
MILSIAAAALALVIVFLVVSLMCTTAQEFIAGLFAMRAKTLEATLSKMLDDEERNKLMAQLYEHPLIKALAPSGRAPSYIPSDQFALAIHDMLSRGRALEVGSVLPVFRILWREAASNEAAFKTAVAKWFDAGMERAGGWYKRKTQRIVLLLGLAIAIVFNIDAVRVAYTVVRLPATAHLAVIDEAVAIGNQKDKATVDIDTLEKIKVPFGWTDDYRVAPAGAERLSGAWWLAWLTVAVGWLITALAASLGAQFWFDILIRVSNIRSTGVKPEAK